MPYSTSNPPRLISQSIGGGVGTATGGPNLWVLTGTDATSSVQLINYITNGLDLGMKKGDLVLYTKTDASPISMQMYIVSAVASTGADLSSGTAITATNSD